MTSSPSSPRSTQSPTRPSTARKSCSASSRWSISTAVAGTYIAVAMQLAMAEQSVPPGKEEPFKPGEP